MLGNTNIQTVETIFMVTFPLANHIYYTQKFAVNLADILDAESCYSDTVLVRNGSERRLKS